MPLSVSNHLYELHRETTERSINTASPVNVEIDGFTLAPEEGDRLLVRVVSVNDNGKVTLPVRELWARRDPQTHEIEYTLGSTNGPYDAEQEILTLSEANEALRNNGGSWLEVKRNFTLHRVGGCICKGSQSRSSRFQLSSHC